MIFVSFRRGVFLELDRTLLRNDLGLDHVPRPYGLPAIYLQLIAQAVRPDSYDTSLLTPLFGLWMLHKHRLAWMQRRKLHFISVVVDSLFLE